MDVCLKQSQSDFPYQEFGIWIGGQIIIVLGRSCIVAIFHHLDEWQKKPEREQQNHKIIQTTSILVERSGKLTFALRHVE